MRTARFAGLVLAVAGICSLTYRELSYTIPYNTADSDALQAAGITSTGHANDVPVIPVLGGALLVGGVALLTASQGGVGRHF
jgi:hypothetical protein